MRNQALEHLPPDGGDIGAGRQVDDLYAEPLRVQGDGDGRGELEGLRVDLGADVHDLTDGNSAELHRRAGCQAADRLIEDEQEVLRSAGGQLEGFGAVAVEGKDRVRLSRWQDRPARRRFEGDA